jgi:multiple sugar transport system ATP-binding protein
VVYGKPANLFVALPGSAADEHDSRASGARRRGVGGGDRRRPAGRGQAAAAGATCRRRGWIDRDAFLGIRPECISDVGRRTDFSTTRFDAEVVMSETTGAETVVLAKAAGERLSAHVAPDVRLPPGQRAPFLADTRTACLFDPKTERLIA